MRTTLTFAALISLSACHASPDQESARTDSSPPGAAAVAPVHPVLPADVAALAKRIEVCEHFSGEDPYDAERAAVLRKQVEANCLGNDAMLAKLSGKYASDPAVAAKLGALNNEYK